MERAYREDELVEATIIDSEGYIYGTVGKVNIDEDKIVLLAQEYKPDVKTVVDVEGLRQELLKNVKMPFSAKFQRLSPEDILVGDIRKEIGLELKEPLTNEHFIKYAERLGILIPYKKADMERKEPKGSVSLQEIRSIRISVIGKEKETKVIKIVLLRMPREAKFRKIPLQEKVPYRSTEALKDKLVLDADGMALGYVDSVVLFQDKPGIRIYSSKTSGLVNLVMLSRFLEETGKPEVAKLVRKHFAEYLEMHRYTVRMEEMEDFLDRMKLTFVLPERVIEGKGVKEFVADIPWDVVHKVGDVVLLKLTLPDLRSQNYLQR